MKKEIKKKQSLNPVKKNVRKISDDDPSGAFPGYPHYPKRDDIMMNGKKTESDMDHLKEKKIKKTPPVKSAPDFIEKPIPKHIIKETKRPVSEADLSDEDLLLLGDKDENIGGEDEKIKKGRVWPIDMDASDLDIPGTDLDDENEDLGEEDEENNFYSDADTD